MLKDDFVTRWPFSIGHFNTISPYLRPGIWRPDYKRQRFELSDGDFIDLDLLVNSHPRLMILCHGLEGNSDSSYIKLFANHFQHRFDIIAMNYRACSGEMNRTLRMYNSGTTSDLNELLNKYAPSYDSVVLTGFSLGGNLILKYLGENLFSHPENLSAAIAISTPLHLSNASQELLKKQNILYQLKFLRSLRKKIYLKHKQFPDQIDLEPLSRIKNLYEFDNCYTAPLFGYRDAEDYYSKNQAIQFLSDIRTPSLLISAKDDPFLGKLCYPGPAEIGSLNVKTSYTTHGGHVGFMDFRFSRKWLLNSCERFLTAHNRA